VSCACTAQLDITVKGGGGACSGPGQSWLLCFISFAVLSDQAPLWMQLALNELQFMPLLGVMRIAAHNRLDGKAWPQVSFKLLAPGTAACQTWHEVPVFESLKHSLRIRKVLVHLTHSLAL